MTKLQVGHEVQGLGHGDVPKRLEATDDSVVSRRPCCQEVLG